MKILVATTAPELRLAITALLRESQYVGVIGEAENGADALRLLHADAWDVAILGIRLPVGGGVHFLQEFKAERPGLPVLMVCGDCRPIAVQPALAAGASGYVMRYALAHELMLCIWAALAGEVYLSAAVAALLQSPDEQDADDRVWVN